MMHNDEIQPDSIKMQCLLINSAHSDSLYTRLAAELCALDTKHEELADILQQKGVCPYNTGKLRVRDGDPNYLEPNVWLFQPDITLNYPNGCFNQRLMNPTLETRINSYLSGKSDKSPYTSGEVNEMAELPVAYRKYPSTNPNGRKLDSVWRNESKSSDLSFHIEESKCNAQSGAEKESKKRPNCDKVTGYENKESLERHRQFMQRKSYYCGKPTFFDKENLHLIEKIDKMDFDYPKYQQFQNNHVIEKSELGKLNLNDKGSGDQLKYIKANININISEFTQETRDNPSNGIDHNNKEEYHINKGEGVNINKEDEHINQVNPCNYQVNYINMDDINKENQGSEKILLKNTNQASKINEIIETTELFQRETGTLKQFTTEKPRECYDRCNTKVCSINELGCVGLAFPNDGENSCHQYHPAGDAVPVNKASDSNCNVYTQNNTSSHNRINSLTRQTEASKNISINCNKLCLNQTEPACKGIPHQQTRPSSGSASRECVDLADTSSLISLECSESLVYASFSADKPILRNHCPAANLDMPKVSLVTVKSTTKASTDPTSSSYSPCNYKPSNYTPPSGGCPEKNNSSNSNDSSLKESIDGKLKHNAETDTSNKNPVHETCMDGHSVNDTFNDDSPSNKSNNRANLVYERYNSNRYLNSSYFVDKSSNENSISRNYQGEIYMNGACRNGIRIDESTTGANYMNKSDRNNSYAARVCVNRNVGIEKEENDQFLSNTYTLVNSSHQLNKTNSQVNNKSEHNSTESLNEQNLFGNKVEDSYPNQNTDCMRNACEYDCTENQNNENAYIDNKITDHKLSGFSSMEYNSNVYTSSDYNYNEFKQLECHSDYTAAENKTNYSSNGDNGGLGTAVDESPDNRYLSTGQQRKKLRVSHEASQLEWGDWCDRRGIESYNYKLYQNQKLPSSVDKSYMSARDNIGDRYPLQDTTDIENYHSNLRNDPTCIFVKDQYSSWFGGRETKKSESKNVNKVPGRIYALTIRSVRCWRAEWYCKASCKRMTRQFAETVHGAHRARLNALEVLCKNRCVPATLLADARTFFGYQASPHDSSNNFDEQNLASPSNYNKETEESKINILSSLAERSAMTIPDKRVNSTHISTAFNSHVQELSLNYQFMNIRANR